MKIIITGGLGFIGSNLAHSLVRKGHEVTILTRSRDKIHNIRGIEDQIVLIEKNMNQMGDIEKIEEIIASHKVIFHLAGSKGNYSILNDPNIDIDDNCRTTLTLLDLCRKHNPKIRIVFASAFFVHGNVKSIPVKENDPCNPLSIFGATRLAGEHFCHVYNSTYDMDIVIARLTNTFGIREVMDDKKRAAFNYLIKLALEDEHIPMYGKGGNIRDLIYVSDTVDALDVLMEKGKRDEVYFIGRGKGIPLKDFLSAIVHETGSGTISNIDPPIFHKKIGITDFVCDVRKLKALGWESKVGMNEGIRKTIEFYKCQINWDYYMKRDKL